MANKYGVVLNCGRERDRGSGKREICGNPVPVGKDNRFYVPTLKTNIDLCTTCAEEVYRGDVLKAIRSADILMNTFGDLTPLWDLLGRPNLLLNESGEPKEPTFLFQEANGRVALVQSVMTEKFDEVRGQVIRRVKPVDAGGGAIRFGSIMFTTNLSRQQQWRAAKMNAAGLVGQGYIRVLRMFQEEIERLFAQLLEGASQNPKKGSYILRQVNAFRAVDAQGAVTYKGDMEVFLKFLAALELALKDAEEDRAALREVRTGALVALAGRSPREGYKRARTVFGTLAGLARRNNVPVSKRVATLVERLQSGEYQMKVLEEVDEAVPVTLEAQEPVSETPTEDDSAGVKEEVVVGGNNPRKGKARKSH